MRKQMERSRAELDRHHEWHNLGATGPYKHSPKISAVGSRVVRGRRTKPLYATMQNTVAAKTTVSSVGIEHVGVEKSEKPSDETQFLVHEVNDLSTRELSTTARSETMRPVEEEEPWYARPYHIVGPNLSKECAIAGTSPQPKRIRDVGDSENIETTPGKRRSVPQSDRMALDNFDHFRDTLKNKAEISPLFRAYQQRLNSSVHPLSDSMTMNSSEKEKMREGIERRVVGTSTEDVSIGVQDFSIDAQDVSLEDDDWEGVEGLEFKHVQNPEKALKNPKEREAFILNSYADILGVLRAEEKRLLLKRRLGAIEDLREPKRNWYELRTTAFSYELQKLNTLTKKGLA